MSLLITVFLLAFVTQLISWIGKKVLCDWAYEVYLRISRNSLAERQRTLKAEILNNKSELLKTSAQDQFAKWARLRRSVDKGLADLEKLNSEVASAKSGFSTKFNSVIWVFTSGVNLAVGYWYGRQAVFFLPEQWLGPLTWWLSFPFAPRGSVSVGVWSFACKRVIIVGERVVKALLYRADRDDESEGSPTKTRSSSARASSAPSAASSSPSPVDASNLTRRRARVESEEESS